jgi:ATP-dependent Clp protease ATP-binding subunit ClpA
MEHLLVGMLGKSRMVLDLLGDTGVDLSALRSQYAQRLEGDPTAPSAEVPRAAEVRRALDEATEHARKLRTDVMTPFVLLRALHEDEGAMAAILRSFGGDVAMLRDRINEQFNAS